MAKTCIVGGGRAGSGEHIFPACLGGHRVNNGIYCERHNNNYGALAALLDDQLAFFNAQFGIKNTRTKQVKPVKMTDPSSGETFEYDGKNLKRNEAKILSQTENAVSIAAADKAALQRFLNEQEARGLKYEVSGPITYGTYHPGKLQAQLSLGGPEGLRAIGYVAQTFFAHCFPDLARDPAMKPFIDYTLKGNGNNFVWWDFEAPSETLPNTFPLGHRIIVGADADTGVAYARFSLFSTLDFSMVFYDLPPAVSSCSVINDINPLASKMPDDLVQIRKTFAVAPVSRPLNITESLRAAIDGGKAEERTKLLMERGETHMRRLDAEELLNTLSRKSVHADKQIILQEFWTNESQRIIRLLGLALSVITAQGTQTDSLGCKIAELLRNATERDETSQSGLTPGAEAAVKVAQDALSKVMAEAISQGSLDQDATEMYIGAGKGADVAARAVLRAGGLPC